MASIDDMATPRTAPEDGYAAILDVLIGLEWPVDADAVTALIEAQGWPVLESSSDGGLIVVDTGWGLESSGPMELSVYDGVLSDITVDTADYVKESTPESVDVLRDAFAAQVALVQERLGAPTSRTRGKIARAKWELANGARLTVECAHNGGTTEIASPAEAQERRDAGE